VFKGLFGRIEEDDAVEVGKFEEQEDEAISIRKCKLRILNTQIIYDSDEALYYTLATCINEKEQVETISLEGFSIESNVGGLVGSYIDYEEFDDFGEITNKGRIYKGDI